MTAQIADTSSQNRLFPKPQRKPFTVGEIFNNELEWDELTDVQSALWHKMKSGQSGSQVHPKGHWFNFYKLDMDGIAPTVPKGCGNAKFCHWDYPKGCSTGHYKLLGSFPERYKFIGNYGMVKQRIGNSVPPLFMKAIAIQIRHVMFGGEPLEDTSKRNEYLDILDEAWQQHLAPRADNAPTVISTFAGCGGSSLGYSMAGYRELLAVEWDDNAVETFKLNFPDVPVYHGDIAKLSVGECLSLASIEPGELDILDGSPPCQGFSTAGKRIMEDDRNQLFREYVRLLRGLKPKVFVMENVSGMVKGKMKLIFAEVMKELKASGYQVKCQLMNAMYFNVPQSRQRLIFIGVRDDLNIEPTYPKAERKPFTVGEVCPGVESFVRDFGLTKPVKIVSANSYPFQTITKTRASGNTRAGDVIIDSVRQKPSIEHIKRGSAFPDKFMPVGTISQKWQRIGNSVPLLFMRSIARHIRTNILTPERTTE